jgi:hypothetical protein
MTKMYAKVGAIIATLPKDEMENLRNSGIIPISKEKVMVQGFN